MLRVFLTILSAVGLLTNGFSQKLIGRVVDSTSLDPIPYVKVTSSSGNSLYTDIEGRFTIDVGLDKGPVSFHSIGYANQTLSGYSTSSHVTVRLREQASEMGALVVLAKEDPAYRIIRQVIKHKPENDPLELTFKYDAYSKFYFSLELDSTMFMDPKTDSMDSYHYNKLKESYLFFTESGMRRYRESAVRDKQEVLYQRASGLKTMGFSLASSELQSFSFYEELISLGSTPYLNPASRKGLRKYDLHLEETEVVDGDSVFTITFAPRRSGFNGISGTFYINSHGYAIQYVEAKPVLNSGSQANVRIRQIYHKIDGHWFPKELNTTLDFTNSDLAGMIAAGRTYIKNVEFAPDFSDVRFNHLAMDYEAKDTGFHIEDIRDSLSRKEQNTYRLIDSLGDAIGLERRMKVMTSLVKGRIPVKFLDIDLAKTLAFNDFEGTRLGLGLYTNHKVSKVFEAGGYFGYGFKDRSWKYGGSALFTINSDYDTKLNLGWSRDVYTWGDHSFRSGSTSLLNNEAILSLFANQMDYVDNWYGQLSTRAFRHFALRMGGERRTHGNNTNYSFQATLDDQIEFFQTGFTVTELQAEVRFAHNERFVKLFGQLISEGSKSPILSLQYNRGVGLFDGDFDYNKLVAKLQWRSQSPGFAVEFRAGYLDQPIPLQLNFAMPAADIGKFNISVPNSFETMQINEFYASEFVYGIVTYSFGKLYKRKWSALEPILVGKALFGQMADSYRHHDFTFNTPDQGYYEAGLYLNGLVLNKWQGFGVGFLYRMGDYAYERWQDNLAIRLTFSYAL